MAYRIETDVQRFYQNQLSKLENYLKKDIKKFELSTKFMRNINTDGYLLIDGTHLVLCEFKDHYNFSTNQRDIGIAIIQALYYMKEFKEKTALIPEALFIGDEDEYFVISTEKLIDLLDENFEDKFWTCPPSDAYRRCPKLLEKILERYSKISSTIKPIIKNTIDLQYISLKLKESFNFKGIKVKFNEDTVKYGYALFIDDVLYRNQDFSSLDKILLFKDIIMKEGYSKFDKSTESLKYDEKIFPINISAYKDFIALYQIKYTKTEQNKLLEKITELYNDRERVEKSAFPKEKVIVDYAHKMMSKNLGSDWKEKYIVWDPRCYTGNLTKGYKFNNLYLSNPFKDELKLLNSNNYKEVFEFDFKDDEIKPRSKGGKLPDELYKALKETPEKVIIFTDPEGGNAAHGEGNNKNKNNNRILPNTLIRNEIKKDSNIENSRVANELSNLYLYRIFKLNVYSFGIFSTTTFLRSSSNLSFKKILLEKYILSDEYSFAFKSNKNFALMFSLFKQKNNIDILQNDINVQFIKFENNKAEKDIKKVFFTGDGLKYSSFLKTKNTSADKISKVVLSMPTTEKPNIHNKKIKEKGYLGSLRYTYYGKCVR